MKRFLQLISLLSVIACSGNKQVDVTGISPSPFVGCWECVGANDSIQNLSVHIGERGDSLFVAFFWERQEPFYMTGNPLSDSRGYAIPQACISVPKSGNKAVGNIVNQYFAVFQNYPENEYYPIAFELKSFDTLTFKISGNVNYWPDSAALVRKSNDNYTFSTEVIDLYRENYLVPDADDRNVCFRNPRFFEIFTRHFFHNKRVVREIRRFFHTFPVAVDDHYVAALRRQFFRQRESEPSETQNRV